VNWLFEFSSFAARLTAAIAPATGKARPKSKVKNAHGETPAKYAGNRGRYATANPRRKCNGKGRLPKGIRHDGNGKSKTRSKTAARSQDSDSLLRKTRFWGGKTI
jgi:hypothetical protein